ncbi:transcription termination factor NusA [candidate division WOR-3 bacterium]|nr:transcription termination factor NusA [candidate division WOR-3 bacterium]
MSILQAIAQMAEERKLPKEFAIDILKDSLISAAQQSVGEDANIDVEMDEAKGIIRVFLVKKVVKRIKTQSQEIGLLKAQKIDETMKLGDELRIELPFEKFGRNAIILVKRTLQQKIRDKDKERVFEEYQSKIGKIETGIVQKVDRYEIIVKLGDAEGFLPLREQIPEERYYQGNTIKAYILDVTSGGRVLLSRTHPDFLKKLLVNEVPEIKEGIIEIKAAARIPGIRAKIAVTSNDSKIDPVGACVGVKGSRIQPVVRELNNEKIDVIQYSSDTMVFTSRALSGVKILEEKINNKENRISIVIKDEELPQAIGKSGHNALLASRLTAMKIDIISESDYKSKGVVFIKGLSEPCKKALISGGFLTSAEILNRGIDKLIQVPGIGEKKAEKIFKLVQKLIEDQKSKEKEIVEE